MWKSNLILITVALLQLLKCSHAYFVTIDAHSEECFFDRVEQGTKMGLMFETIEGGFLDIDIKITGPDNQIIYQGERESSNKYAFSAPQTGVYTYCFSNKMSTVTPKIVMFTMEIGETPKATTEGAANQEVDGSPTKLEDMIKELARTLTSVKHDQEYMNVRDKIHRAINESTNSRVVLWSTFEALVLVVMTVGQVYYLKRFFEVRRVV